MLNIPKIIPSITARINDITAISTVTRSPLSKLGKLSCINDIIKNYNNKNILIVTHNGVARAIYVYFNGIPKDGKIWKIGTQKNCEIRKYNIK